MNNEQERKQQLGLWRDMINQFFKGNIGETLRITEPHQIKEAINAVGKNQALNHIFMPPGGEGLIFTVHRIPMRSD